MKDLLGAGVLETGQRLVGRRAGAVGKVCDDGSIAVEGVGVFRSPSLAAMAVLGRNQNGWTFWEAEIGGDRVPLSRLREGLRTA